MHLETLSSRSSEQYPDYVNLPTRGPATAIVCGILGVIAAAVVVARFRSRLILQRNPGLDDWVFLAAMPFATALIICVCLATTVYQYDRHQWDTQLELRPSMKKMMLATCISYIVSTCGIKISVLLFYKRLTSGKLSSIYTWSVRTVIVGQALYLLACLLTVCLPCRPLEAYWMRESILWLRTHNYKCLNEGDALLSMGAISVVQDLLATLLPYHLISQMALPRRQKNALYATFVGGILVCIIGISRECAIWSVNANAKDLPWHWYFYALASGVEVALGVICASLPALKYYFRAYFEPQTSYNTNVIFVGDSELSDFTDYEDYVSSSNTKLTSDLSKLEDLGSFYTKQKLDQHATFLEPLDGDELLRSGIITSKALLYDSTHVRGRVASLHDPGGLISDD